MTIKWNVVAGIALLVLAGVCLGAGPLLSVGGPPFTGSVLLTRAAFVLFVASAWLLFLGMIRNNLDAGKGRTLRHMPDAAENTDSAVIPQLKAMGFRYLGTFQLLKPNGDESVRSQNYVDGEEVVTAAVATVVTTEAVEFRSHLSDETILTVTYPWGANITEERLIWRTNTHDVAATHHQIQSLINQHSPDHGRPTRVRRPADAVEREDAYTKHASHIVNCGLHRYGYAQVAGLVLFTGCMLWMGLLDWPSMYVVITGGAANIDMDATLYTMLIVSMVGIFGGLMAPMLLLAPEVAKIRGMGRLMGAG